MEHLNSPRVTALDFMHQINGAEAAASTCITDRDHVGAVIAMQSSTSSLGKLLYLVSKYTREEHTTREGLRLLTEYQNSIRASYLACHHTTDEWVEANTAAKRKSDEVYEFLIQHLPL